MILLIPVAGWFFAFGSVVTWSEHLGALIEASPHPSEELIEEWANDGGRNTFALLFGWLYSLLYALPWLAVFGIAQLVRRGVRSGPQGSSPRKA